MEDLFNEIRWREFLIFLGLTFIGFSIDFWWGLGILGLSFLYSFIFLD